MVAMKPLDELLDLLREERPFLEKRYHVETIAIFGSYTRAEQGQDSDLDVLVTFRQTPSLLTLVNMENYLSDCLGVSVDLVMASSLRPTVAKRVAEDLLSV